MRASSEIEQQVEAVLDEFAAAYARKDVDAAIALFSDDEDAVVFGTGADEVRVGREQVADQLRRDFAEAGRLLVKFGDARISAAGEVAWAATSDASIDVTVAGEDQSLSLRLTARTARLRAGRRAPSTGTKVPSGTPTGVLRRRTSYSGRRRSGGRASRKNLYAILPHIMALNIKDEAADRLARELAAETGESITTAVTVAVRERLERLRGAVPREQRRQELARISQRSARRRVLDRRSAEEILGYGPDGLPS
jgi:antitoxin VapB